MIVMAPSDENETRQMLYTGFIHEGPATIRYPRGKGPGTEVEYDMTALEIGKARLLRQGTDIAILAFGSMVTPARDVAATLNATLVDMRFVKPLDTELISDMALNNKLIVTIEENCISGGAGSAVNEFLNQEGFVIGTLNLGVPDTFVSQDKPDNMLAACGLNQAGILASIHTRISNLELKLDTSSGSG
jgi:1-deoxy-D-xylulose-5-phosphate synthase